MLKAFLNNFKSFILATLDENQNPYNSYAPFIYKNNHFYIFISDIAKHSQNLKRVNHASIFFIENEENCENIFARKRVILESTSSLIEKEDILFHTILEQFEKEHGPTVKMLRKMSDFNLFEFTVLKGEAVFGFGEAYDIKDHQLILSPRNSKGHK